MALVVDATNYITASPSSHEAFKTATLLKTLNVNVLISGEIGVGKETLAHYIVPDATVVDMSDVDELLHALNSLDKIIILNFDNSTNLTRVIDAIDSSRCRVIATTQNSFFNHNIDDIFSVKFNIPPLRDRVEDIPELVEIFTKEANLLFATDVKFDSKNLKTDLSGNAVSLKRQIMINSLLNDIKDVELMSIIESYISDKLGSQSDYRDLLYLYEVPLIRAGLSKFKSQLQLSDKLGLNRNTLRKKIADNKDYL